MLIDATKQVINMCSKKRKKKGNKKKKKIKIKK